MTIKTGRDHIVCGHRVIWVCGGGAINFVWVKLKEEKWNQKVNIFIAAYYYYYLVHQYFYIKRIES